MSRISAETLLYKFSGWTNEQLQQELNECLRTVGLQEKKLRTINYALWLKCEDCVWWAKSVAPDEVDDIVMLIASADPIPTGVEYPCDKQPELKWVEQVRPEIIFVRNTPTTAYPINYLRCVRELIHPDHLDFCPNCLTILPPRNGYECGVCGYV